MAHLPSFWLMLALLLPAPVSAGSFNRVPSPPKAAEATATPQAAPPASPAPVAAPVEATAKPADEVQPEAGHGDEVAGAPTTEPASDGLADPMGEPTYGEACIYGPRGVVHAPLGRDCEAEQARKQAAAAALASPGSGRCIFGRDGEVVHAPPGESCEGRVRNVAPTPPARRRRGYLY